MHALFHIEKGRPSVDVAAADHLVQRRGRMPGTHATGLQPAHIIVISAHRLAAEYPDDRDVGQQHHAGTQRGQVVELIVGFDMTQCRDDDQRAVHELVTQYRAVSDQEPDSLFAVLTPGNDR